MPQRQRRPTFSNRKATKRRKIYKLLKKKFTKASRASNEKCRIHAKCIALLHSAAYPTICTCKNVRYNIYLHVIRLYVVDAARADHTRTRNAMKIILKYLFKSTLFIRVIYLFYSFSISFYFIFRIRMRPVISSPSL